MKSIILGVAGTAACAMSLPTLAGDPAAALELLGRYETSLFDAGAAEIAAYDAATQRLFVVNGGTASIDIIDISNPSMPALVSSIDVTPWGGGANSVAVKDGVVAAAIQANVKQDPGRVAFFDANGAHLADVEVGALPDMLCFTPDGTKVVVCNEGEPSDDYANDPEGSVSIIDISGGAANVTQSDVATADFAAFNGAIDPAVRITGPGATVAQDLEPEYAAVSKDSRTAWVTLQENNAVAIVDLTTATVNAIVPLGMKNHASGTPEISYHPVNDLPLLGTTAAGQDILLGGFSGLWFDEVDAGTGHWRFLTIPDRGPNAEPLDVDDDGVAERPFPLPDYQARYVVLDLDPVSGALTILDQVPLWRQDGATPISGLPNTLCTSNGLAYQDEEPCDVFGNPLPLDGYGADMEGIVRADDGTLWTCDEYRPALYHFQADGMLIARYVPEGSNCSGDDVGIEAFPAVYAQRRANRGFEGLAYWDGLVYAFIQSPLDNPDVPNDSSSKNSLNGRMLVFDPIGETTIAEYLFRFEGNGSDKVGDAVAYGPGRFLVIERDSSTGPAAQKKVFEYAIDGATDLSTLDPSIAGPGGTLELMSAQDLADNGIVPMSKSVWCDLSAAGYTFTDKAEGLALIHPGLIAVINDNDFQLAGGLDPQTGLIDFLAEPQPVVMGLVSFSGNGLDASRNDGININGWPVKGFYMPDGIEAFEAAGQTWLITANEGDARDYAGFVDETKVSDETLDPRLFRLPGLQTNALMGRLAIVNTSGDLDGDGDLDELHSYGARSFSIWNTEGELVWDSGDQLEQLTAALLPDGFNMSNDDNDSFDKRSSSKGPEPEGVTVGTFGDLVLAFVGLERIGGVVIVNVTDPTSPVILGYRNDRDFAGDPANSTAGDLGPEGLLIIEAGDSPIGEPLLVVANEVSGSTDVYRIDVDAAVCSAPADLNNDCVVDYADLVEMLSAWGPCFVPCKGDLDNDGMVGMSDLLQLLAAWTV